MYSKAIKRYALITVMAIVMVALVCLCACQTNQNSGSKINVKDLEGTEFSFDAPISKVVTTHNPTFNQVVVLGNGTSKYLAASCDRDKANALYSKVLDDWNQLELIGGNGTAVNKETVIKLHPDLALVAETLAKYKDEDYGGTGIDTFVTSPKKESFDATKDSLKQISILFGEEERADKIIDAYDKIANKNTDKVSKLDDSSKPKVLFMGSKKYKVATDDMIQTQIVEKGGGINVAKDEYDSGFWANADAESIVKMNPDVIYFVNYATFTKDELLNDEKLQNVNAIKNKKVYEFPCALEPWDYPTMSTCLGLSWTVNNLHPDLKTNDELYKDCTDFYQLLYNKSFTAEEMGIK